MEGYGESGTLGVGRIGYDRTEEILSDEGRLQKILDCLFTHLPERFEEAKDLLMASATFREVCDDYTKIRTIIAANCRAEGTLPEICEHASDLAGELEKEISRLLNSSGLR